MKTLSGDLPLEDTCSTHPKAPHGFNRGASHMEDKYVCDCRGFDPYEAGYEAGYRDGMDAVWSNQ